MILNLQLPCRRVGRVIGAQRAQPGRSRRPVRPQAFRQFAPVRLPDRWEEEDEASLILALLLRPVAMVGTAAVVLGHLLHVPALSTLHWSGGNAWLGLQLAAPIILLDLPLMDLWPKDGIMEEQEEEEEWEEEEQEEWDGRPGTAMVAEALAADPDLASLDLDDVEADVPHPLWEALDSLRDAQLTGAWLGLSPGPHLGLLLVHHLAEEMLWRAVALGALGSTAAAVLYTAGLEDFALALGGWQLGVPQVSAALAAALCTLWSAAAAFQREWAVVGVFDSLAAGGFTVDAEFGGEAAPPAGARGGQAASAEESEGEEEEEDREAEWAEHRAWLASYMRRERAWAGAFEALRDSTATACLSAAFLLTGNLLAPYVAAVAADLVSTLYQRSRQQQALASVQFWDDLVEQALQAEEEERLERLARLGLGPPPASAGRRDEGFKRE